MTGLDRDDYEHLILIRENCYTVPRQQCDPITRQECEQVATEVCK